VWSCEKISNVLLICEAELFKLAFRRLEHACGYGLVRVMHAGKKVQKGY
jgi:hypothetical protein